MISAGLIIVLLSLIFLTRTPAVTPADYLAALFLSAGLVLASIGAALALVGLAF